MRKFTKREERMQAQIEAAERAKEYAEATLKRWKEISDAKISEADRKRLQAEREMWVSRKNEAQMALTLITETERAQGHFAQEMCVTGMTFEGFLR